MKSPLIRSAVLCAGLGLLCGLFAPAASADPSFASHTRWWWGWHGKNDRTGTPPIITTQPVSQTVATGSAVTMSVVAVPDPSVKFVTMEKMHFQWHRNGWPIEDATKDSFTIDAASLDDAGVYSVVVRWGPGWVRSAPAALSVAAQALTLTGPADQIVKNGSDVSFAVTGGTNLSYKWRFQSRMLASVTGATLAIDNAGTTAAGAYSVDVSDATGLLARYFASLRVETDARLTNLSTRGLVGTEAERLTVGFVITGAGKKEILLRGIGPTLATQFNVAYALAEPTLTLYSGFGRKLDANTGWGGTAELMQAFEDVGAFELDPLSADSALLKTLDAGIYTAAVTGKGDTTGVALAELYDLDEGAPKTELVNVSARAFVGTEDKVLIAGFVIKGTTSNTLLVRGIGPTLHMKFGLPRALAQTRIAIFDSQGNPVSGNTGWGDDEDVDETGDYVGAFKLGRGTKDSALLVTLPPGAYTAQVSGVNSETGIALVEVYEVR